MKFFLFFYIFIIIATSVFAQQTSSFTDPRDGNIYKTVQIGEQVWMAENLKYLPSVNSPDSASLAEPCYYVYGYDGTNVSVAKATENYATYGVLYNWPAAMAGAGSSNANPSGVQGICPVGWHLPSDVEWQQLEMYLGMSPEQANFTELRGTDEGGKLKETGTTHWADPNTGATNETGFTALPGGYRHFFVSFQYIGFGALWWSATEGNFENAYYRSVGNDSSFIYRYFNPRESGFSVRCVKN